MDNNELILKCKKCKIMYKLCFDVLVYETMYKSIYIVVKTILPSFPTTIIDYVPLISLIIYN